MLLVAWSLNAIQPTPTSPVPSPSAEPATSTVVSTVVSTVTAPPSSTIDVWFFDPWPTDVFAAWGQWAGGIGSILAVVAAVWVVRRDSKIKRRDEHELRVSRARGIIASPAERPPSGDGGFAISELGFEVTNHSQAPVLEVEIRAIVVSEVNGRSGDRKSDARRLSLTHRVLGPGDHEFQENDTIGKAWDDFRAKKVRISLVYSYLDAEGYRWHRVDSGRPEVMNSYDRKRFLGIPYGNTYLAGDIILP